MATDAVDTDHPDRTGPPARRSPLSTLFRVVAGLIIVASFGVWVYAYSGLAERDAPDLLDDRAAVSAAEQLCAGALADIASMPGALEASDGVERGQQIDQTTDRLEEMVDELDEIRFEPARDRSIVDAWLADWRVLLEDRRRYAEAIAADPQAQFLVTDTGDGERLERRVTRLATTNDMESCSAPRDVG